MLYYKKKSKKMSEIKPALQKLTELNMTMKTVPELKELYELIKLHLNNDKQIDICIPLVETNRVLRGSLEIDETKPTWIKIECLE